MVESDLFSKALEKILEPQDVQYIQAIVAKRLEEKELNPREISYLASIEENEALLATFDTLINAVSYKTEKKGSDMNTLQDLPHFDSEGNADAQKVLARLRGKEYAEKRASLLVSPEPQAYRAGRKNGIEGIDEAKQDRMITTAE